MLTINIPDREYFDEITNEFIYVKGKSIVLEHSLLSISKWESKWKKPFPGYQPENVAKINNIKFTPEEFIDYLKCMCITQNVDERIFTYLPGDILYKIKAYMEDPMTATTFKKLPGGSRSSNKIVTNELVYFWMASYRIPFEAAKWHINRLLTLINIASVENAPKKKMSSKEVADQHRAVNAARRKSRK